MISMATHGALRSGPRAIADSGGTLAVQIAQSVDTLNLSAGSPTATLIGTPQNNIGETVSAPGVWRSSDVNVASVDAYTGAVTLTPGAAIDATCVMTYEIDDSDEYTGAAGQTMQLDDNMDEYPDIATLGATLAGPMVTTPSPGFGLALNGSADVITGRGGSGKALSMIYFGANQQSATFLTWPPLSPDIPGTATHRIEMWVQMPMVAPGIDFTNTAQIHIKFILIIHKNGGGRIQFNMGNWFGENRWCITDDYNDAFTNRASQPKYGALVKDIVRVAPLVAPWHKFKFKYRCNSAPGARDGFAQMWIDGVREIDCSLARVNVVPPNSAKEWALMRDLDALSSPDPVPNLYFGSTQTGDTVQYRFNIDDLKWWWTL